MPRSLPFLFFVVCLFLGVSARGDLVGYWTFDSDFSDSSGNGNHFSLVGGTVPIVPGRIGNAASFDGLASRLENTSAGLLGTYTSFTLGAHVFVRNTPAGSDAAILAGSSYEMGLTFNNDNRVYAYAGAGSLNA